MINVFVKGLRVTAQPQSCVCLWVQINYQYSLAHLSKGCREIHCGGCFATTAFLVRYRYRSHIRLFYRKLAAQTGPTRSSAYSNGRADHHTASQPGKQYGYNAGQLSIDFFVLLLLVKIVLAVFFATDYLQLRLHLALQVISAHTENR